MTKFQLKKMLKRNLTFLYIRRLYWSVWTELYSKKVDDLTFVNRAYKKDSDMVLNLQEPSRFAEKLQWLKLFYRNPLIERCSDKQGLKEYLSKIGHGDLALETVAIYDNVDDIDINALPDKFVMKATHGSGWNLICTDKSTLDWKKWKRLFKIWLKQNPHWLGREWNYKDIKPRIIVENYLEDDTGGLRDYKVFCFNGKAEFMQVDEDRYVGHKRKYFDRDFNEISVKDSKKPSGTLKVTFGDAQTKMFEIAEELSKPFPHVRIDFYELSGKIFIGEFTFFHESGLVHFHPDEMDFVFGDMLTLPEANYNLDILNMLEK